MGSGSLLLAIVYTSSSISLYTHENVTFDHAHFVLFLKWPPFGVEVY